MKHSDPASWTLWGFDTELGSTITVWEDEDPAIPTGLLDVHGTPLYRVREKFPFGFRGKT